MSLHPAPRPIDALRSPPCPGRYEDDVVVVEPAAPAGGGDVVPRVRTRHFDLGRSGDRLHVTHRLPTDAIDDDLAHLVAGELFGPGWLAGTDVFERVFTGVVLSSGPDAVASWERFYRNTLGRLPGLAGYGPVYERAAALVPAGSVLDAGCCFGFLALHLARRPGTTAVTASDVSAATVRLLSVVAERLAVPLGTLVADAARLPLPGGSVDTVTLVHLLEHLDPSHGAAVVAEAVRVSRRRVVVAVPLEEEPDPAYGHVRAVGLDDLGDLGRTWQRERGLRWQVTEHHGGWLVLDAP